MDYGGTRRTSSFVYGFCPPVVPLSGVSCTDPAHGPSCYVPSVFVTLFCVISLWAGLTICVVVSMVCEGKTLATPFVGPSSPLPAFDDPYTLRTP